MAITVSVQSAMLVPHVQWSLTIVQQSHVRMEATVPVYQL